MSDENSPGEIPGRRQYWTVADVAEYIGMSPNWVYRKSREGVIPTIRVGRCIRFLPQSIDAWLAACEANAA